MEQAELAVVLGFVVSLVLQLLKRMWTGLDTSEAIVKQIVAVLLAAISVFAAAGWQFTGAVAWQAALAAISALATHKALLKTPEPEA